MMLAASVRVFIMSFTTRLVILRTLILESVLFAVIQAVVYKEEMQRLLPDNSPKSIAVARGLGAAVSSIWSIV